MNIKYSSVLVLFLFPLIILAREGIQHDFPFYVVKATVDITVEKDGSYEFVGTGLFRIQNDDAKKYFAPFKLPFDPSEEDISVVEAYVINDGVKIEVDKTNIQKSNSAAKKDGIVNQSEIAIPFSQIKPDTLVYFKTISKHKAGPFGDYFNFKNNYGDQIPEIQDIVRIKSPKKLFFTIQDPSQVLQVKSYKDNEGYYILESQLVRSHSYIAFNEIGRVSSEDTTSLKVSTSDSWEKLRQLINTKFISVQLQDSLPQALQEAINKIPKDASFEKKVDAAFIYITSNYDYLGDWRGAGKLVPKKIEKIVADHFGDCKDFSTLLVRMLREMNIKADYALVQRSYSASLISEKSVPLLDYFNHMIVRVENEGKVYWVDPTNSYSVGLDTRADISGRSAFVLGENKNTLENIPEIDLSKQLISSARLYQFESPDSAAVEVIYRVKGENAKIILDALKHKNSAEKQDFLMKAITKNERNAVMSFSMQDTKDKAYYDLHIKTKYKTNQLMIKENNSVNGKIELPSLDFVSIFLSFRHDGIGNADIKTMPKVENTYFYKNIYLTGSFPRVCNIKSDWVDASRIIEARDTGILLKDQIAFKKSVLTKEIYANRSFASIAENLSECFVGNYAEFTYNSKKHTDNLTAFEESLATLTVEERMENRVRKSFEIIDSRAKAKNPKDMVLEDSRLLLEKNLAEKPNDSESLRAMSAYYAANAFLVGDIFIDSELKLALEFVEKAIVADPKNLTALIDKVEVLYKSKMFDASKELLTKSVEGVDTFNIDYTTLRKIMDVFFRFKDKENAFKYFDLALKIAPNDIDRAVLYANRAIYYLNIGQYPLCINDYEQSLKFNDKKAWTYGNVAICYNNTKQYDLAIERARKAISIMNYGAAHSGLADSYLGKGKDFCEQKNYKECEENYQLALLEFPRADIYLSLFSLYKSQGQHEKAVDAAQKAINSADETHPVAWVKSELKQLQENFINEKMRRNIASENKQPGE